MKAIIRIDEPATGLQNMAVDEDLLRGAEHCNSLILRIYRWIKPTLSLGHFQREHDVPANVPWGQIDRVTRKTGGGAIVHDRELTYSLVIPHHRSVQAGSSGDFNASEVIPSFGTKGPSELIYRAVHNGIVEGLRELQINAKLAEECTCKPKGEGGSQSFLCFERRSPVDIVIDGVKVVGSAQRRTQFGLLQHGSFLLRRSPSAESLAGILDFWDAREASVSPGDRGAFDAPRSTVERSGGPEPDSIDWERWTDWLAGNLRSSVEKAFAGYWLFG